MRSTVMVKYILVFIATMTASFLSSYGQYNYKKQQYEMQHPNAYYLPETWPAYTLKLTREGELRELYDAGLSPGYTSMARNTELALKHVRLKFILANTRHLPEFAAEQGRITVTRAGLLRLKFISQPMSVEEAKITMLKWLPFFSEKRRKSPEQLKDFLKKANADYSGYDDPNFGAAPKGFSGGWKDDNGIGYGVRFEKAWNEILPVRMCLNVVWHYVRNDKEEGDFYPDRIPSPEGYEIPILKNWGSDSVSEMMYAKGIPFPDGMSLAGTGGKVIEAGVETQSRPKSEAKPTLKPKVGGKKTSLPKEKQSYLPWIIVGVLIVGILLALFKAKSTS